MAENDIKPRVDQLNALATEIQALAPPNTAPQVGQKKPSWDALRSELEANVVPALRIEYQLAFSAKVTDIDALWFVTANGPEPSQRSIAAYLIVSGLRHLGELIQREAPEVRALASAVKREPRPEAVEKILDASAEDVGKRVLYYAGAGAVAGLSGIGMAVAAALVPYIWRLDPLEGWHLLGAVGARLLVVVVLGAFGIMLIRLAKELVEKAARVRELRAHLKMIAAVQFFGSDAEGAAGLVDLLKTSWPGTSGPQAKEESGIYLPGVIVKELPDMVKGLLKGWGK